ncbi:hypothetical protein SNE40_018258 [Patella caerulea]|uniref:Uncharacterized protein n=2 Tax=Patella caerulea TaxID=87958 RepID=A0AAN8JAC5_PATCE
MCTIQCFFRSENTHRHPVQIIGMSATLPNIHLLAKWLFADLYVTDYRPVPLTECIKIGTSLYDSQFKKRCDIDNDYIVPGDDEHIIPLCLETVSSNHSVLIFCPTRNWCEKLCETIAREFYRMSRDSKCQGGTGFNFFTHLDNIQLVLLFSI